MATNSRIGKNYSSNYLKNVPDSVVLVEAAMRRGQSMSTLITPSSPSASRIGLAEWKTAYLVARNIDFPNRNLLYSVYDNIMIDNTLTSIIDTRILKVQQSKFNIFGKDKKPNPELTYLFERQWFQNFLKYAMESRFEGYRLIEFFDFKENGEIIDCNVVNKYHVKPELGIVTKEAGDEKGWDYLNGNQAQFYIPVGDRKDLGILFKAAPHVLAKKYALGTWAEYNEKIGIPFRTVHTPINDKVRQGQLATIMENMGSAGWAVLNNDEKVELLENAGTDPTKCFDGLVNKMDAETAMLILGQTATSNSSKNKGTYGSMEILMQISKDRYEADLTFIKYLINDVLIPRMVTWGYKIPLESYFDWDRSIDLSTSEVVDYVVKLSDVYSIPAEFVTEKTGIPIDGLKTATPTNKPAAVIKKKSLINRLSAFYSECCGDHSTDLFSPAAAAVDFSDIVLNVAKKIFDGKQTGIIDKPLLKATAKHLREGILTGYGKAPDDEDIDISDLQMLQHLEKNVYVFSGYKTYQTLRDITNLLKDENGNLRLFNEFKKEVLQLNDTYNKTYLKAEYEHAVVSSQSASLWQEIQRTKDTLPLLEFDATLDKRTTSECRALDGMILPADHEKWKTMFLPLHWGERSVIRQLASGKITDIETIAFPDLKPMFKNNVGITGVAFPASHPYYEASKADKKVIEKEAKKAMPKKK